jgi:hypothetical protein
VLKNAPKSRRMHNYDALDPPAKAAALPASRARPPEAERPAMSPFIEAPAWRTKHRNGLTATAA